MDPSIGNSAFQEALQRARQLAAKIGQPNSGMKRPMDDGFAPDSKKMSLESDGDYRRPQRNQLYLNGAIFNGEKTLDLMVPGNKVGFVIGKGGDMIRNLQDRAGVKMVVFQETSEAGDREKQLRITGPPDKVDYAKQLVHDLLAEKELESQKMKNGPRGMGGMNAALNEYGSSRLTFFEYPVSPQLIGLVIGKGGDTIRKIQADSGCKVQFDTVKVDNQGNKICQFTGSQEAVNKAVDMVKEIIDAASGGGGSGGGGVGGQQGGGLEEIRLVVPASRTGTVIGRGGETIRALKQQSGCNIELDKSFQSDNEEKCFIIRGTADKIGYAQQLVTDKVGGHATVIANSMQANPLYNDNPYGYLTSQIYANQLGQGQSSSSSSAAASAQYYWPQTSSPSSSSPAAANSDPKASQDQYAMWAAYYAQYYAQGGTGNGSPGGGGSAAAAGASQDPEEVYRQWIEYYKAYGAHKEAEAMEQKLFEYQQSKKSGDENGSESRSRDHRSHSHNGNSDHQK